LTVDATQPYRAEPIVNPRSNAGISFLNDGAFGSLTMAQIAILTTAQKASLSPAQHMACGC
jgi:hypothetical protein